MTGTIRVIAEVTGGTVKLDTVPAGVNATFAGYGNATNGSATSIAFEGSVANVTTALAGLKAQRTGTGAAQVSLNAVPAITSGNAWNYDTTNGHYYEAVKTHYTWSQAKTAAESAVFGGMAGYLVSITNQQENNTVASLLEQSGLEIAYWTGMTDQTSEGTFLYGSGPELGSVVGFTSWRSGEPNGGNAENYVSMNVPDMGRDPT